MLLEEVNPEVAQLFCEEKELEKLPVKNKRLINSVVGAFEISNQSELKFPMFYSPIVEKMCLTISANESFVRAEEYIELLSGIKVSKNSVHRMVKRYEESEENNREILINYHQHQTKELSAVKQIKTRTNIAGARWSKRGIRKILSVRTAYLNKQFSFS